MHVHASDDISVAHTATMPTGEHSPARFSAFPTRGTRAAGSPLTAREAERAGGKRSRAGSSYSKCLIDVIPPVPLQTPLAGARAPLWVPRCVVLTGKSRNAL